MRMYDIIAAKRDGRVLTKKEMEFFIGGLVKKEIPDYQASALLMAIYLKGMDKKEVGEFTNLMAGSGQIADLGAIPGVKVDKHSTGGVGDKTTLIVAPIVASCGVRSPRCRAGDSATPAAPSTSCTPSWGLKPT
jgi:pyrimidine-nucleoside phosphorylase